MTLLPELDEAARVIRERIPVPPRVGVVLGSGLGGWGDELAELVKVPYADIPGMPGVGGNTGKT